MKKNVIIFLVGMVIGSGSYWTLRDGPLAKKVRDSALVQGMGEAIDKRATERMKEEMTKNGKIVVKRPGDSAVAPIDDGLLSDLVKAKIAAEPKLAETKIKEEVKSGEVTLQGTAASYEEVARAIHLALDCKGTKTVVSTIEVTAK